MLRTSNRGSRGTASCAHGGDSWADPAAEEGDKRDWSPLTGGGHAAYQKLDSASQRARCRHALPSVQRVIRAVR